MIVVSDTSPITNLIEIGRLNLLRELFGEVFIPTAVFREATFINRHRIEVDNCDWIRVVSLGTRDLFDTLAEKLDRGEAEAIALAVELSAELILIDETAGRSVAAERGLVVTGLLGILIRGKKQGLIPSVRPEIDRLISDADFRVSATIIAEAVRLADEE